MPAADALAAHAQIGTGSLQSIPFFAAALVVGGVRPGPAAGGFVAPPPAPVPGFVAGGVSTGGCTTGGGFGGSGGGMVAVGSPGAQSAPSSGVTVPGTTQ